MRGIAGILLAASLLACGDEDRTQTDFAASTEKVSTSLDDSAATVAPAAPGAADTVATPQPRPGSVAFQLLPAPGDSAGGEGTATAIGAATLFQVTLRHGISSETYAGTVQEGSCARPGTTIASLNPVTSDSTGRGGAAGDVPVPLDSLLKHPHVVVYGPGGRKATCAALGRASLPDTAMGAG